MIRLISRREYIFRQQQQQQQKLLITHQHSWKFSEKNSKKIFENFEFNL